MLLTSTAAGETGMSALRPLRFVGEVIDPEDGPVWRWDWPVPAA